MTTTTDTTTTDTPLFAMDLDLAEYDPDCLDWYVETARAIAPDLGGLEFYDARPDLADPRICPFARPVARFWGPASALEAIYIRWYIGGYDDPILATEMAGASLDDVRVYSWDPRS